MTVELAGAVRPARFEQRDGFVEVALSRALRVTDGGPLVATMEWDCTYSKSLSTSVCNAPRAAPASPPSARMVIKAP